MLVTRVIGSCPKCNTQNAFGNVNVSQNILTRGCGFCNHSQIIPLPELSKQVVYLDQSFLSHAFRDQLPEYRTCIDLIRQCAHSQLIVCPRSSIHEIETKQWRSDRKEQLWEFVKRTSRGHEFESVHSIKKAQLLRAFDGFLLREETPLGIVRDDALPDDINVWEDYFVVEVSMGEADAEEIRKAKELTTSRLPGLFESWRKDSRSHEEHLEYELQTAASIYTKAYTDMIARLAAGEYTALNDSRIESEIVQAMVSRIEEHPNPDYTKVGEFFRSKHFRDTPYERISCGLVTVFRDRIKSGQYTNPDKIKERLSGFFYDVEHIAAHAPYCDIMFLDAEQHGLVMDKHMNLTDLYGTQFYSKTNIDAFEDRLRSMVTNIDPAITAGVELVYPEPKIST